MPVKQNPESSVVVATESGARTCTGQVDAPQGDSNGKPLGNQLCLYVYSSNKLAPDRSLEDDMFPQGYQRREILAVNKPGRKWWNKTQWAWRSGGPRIHAGIETTSTSTCLTYFQCSGCKFYARPKVHEKPRAKQLGKGCPSCGAKDCWIHPECSAVTHLWAEGDKVILEHEDTHNHTRPPQQGRLTEAQREHIKTQIIRRMKATPHELQTGDELPGSLPLGEISPALNDPWKA
jgi:hypothetical protein